MSCLSLFRSPGLFAAMSVVIPVAAIGQDAPFVERPLVGGMVQDSEQRPVKRARVWLVGGDFGSPLTLGETTSDENGRFAFSDLVDDNIVFAHPQFLTVWAQSDTLIGWQQLLVRSKPIGLTLTPAVEFAGRLISANDVPVVSVTVTPKILTRGRIAVGNSTYAQLSPEMSDALKVATDADGRFTLPGLPDSGVLILEMSLPDSGPQQFSCNLGQPLTIRLPQTSSVAGRVVWPNSTTIPDDVAKKGLGTADIYTYTLLDVNGNVVSDAKQAACSMRQSISSKIQGDGSFLIDGVPTGRCRITATLNETVPLQQPEGQALVVQHGTPIRDLELSAKQAIRISGRVLGFSDRKPVAGATVQLMSIAEGRASYSRRVTTDAGGRYTAYIGAANIRVTVADCPKNYVPLDGGHGNSEELMQRIPTLEVAEDFDWPDLLLDPAGNVEIHVVDSEGHPVPGAIVKVVTAAGYPPQNDYQAVHKTDPAGRYVITQVALNDTLPIRVQTLSAISESGLIVTPGELNGPVKVVLSADHGFRFRCRVIDNAGVPIEGAYLSFSTSYPFKSKWVDSGLAISGSAGSAKTDKDGIAISGPVWPDMSYRVSASADGYGRAEAPQTRGKLGTIVDLQPFVLRKSQPPISGGVADTSGNPLKGVRVFCGGEGWAMASTLTDESGQYRLEEVAPDVRYVFADLAGFRLGGAKVVRGQSVTDISLRSNDSTPVGLRQVRHPDRQSQLQTARRLIEQAWDLPMNPRSTARIGLLEAMVQIDPEQAAVMSGSAGGHFDDIVRCEQARRIVHESPELAFDLLNSTRNARGLTTMVTLGTGLAASQIPAEKELAGRLAALASTASDGLSGLGRTIPLLRSTGRNDEANEIAKKMLDALEPGRADARTQELLLLPTAVALAPVDFETAELLVARTREGYTRTGAGADIAVAIAAQDPEKAIARLLALRGDGNAPNIRDRGRLRIALKIFDTHPDRAVTLVQSCEEPDNRAQALGHIAVRVAESDKPGAWKLIDEALAVHRSKENAYQSWTNYGEGGPFAAALAYQAKLADYPDMESVVWHVLAAARAKGMVTRGQYRLNATIGTARILALVDQFAARDLLNCVADLKDQIPRKDGGTSLYDQWLQAWLLVDFGTGAKLLGDELEEFVVSGQQDPLRRGHGNVFRLLVAEPGAQFKVVTDRETGLWQLDEE